MSTTQEIPTTSPIGREHASRRWPAESDRQGAVHLRLPLSRDAVCRAGRGDDRQRPSCQTRHGRGREDARRARDFSSREHRQDLPLGPGARIRRHLRRAAAAVRGRCRSLLRPVHRARCGGHVRDRQSRCRCGSRDVRRRRSRTSRPISKRTTIPTWLPRRSARASDCRASAATPRLRSQPRRSSSTKPTSRRPRRTTRSSCTRRPRSGMARH